MHANNPVTLRQRCAPVLAIVVPCYNEEAALPESAATLLTLLLTMIDAGEVDAGSYVCFVDDGSRDGTWALIAQLAAQNPTARGIKLSRNFGHQGAVMAGMLECEGDAIVTIDADLQDDENCIREMVRKYREGFDVVLGVRNDRRADTAFKRTTAEAYYGFLNWMGVRITRNHADYRLLSRPALEALGQYEESNLFLRGIVPLLGHPTCTVEYPRRERRAGTSNYPLAKMLALAWEGVTSFSVMPLRVVAAIGAIIALCSLAISVWALGVRLLTDSSVPGWASTVLPIYFIGGVQILCIGVVGEYVGKIYMETKRRPRYLIQVRTWMHARDPMTARTTEVRAIAERRPELEVLR